MWQRTTINHNRIILFNLYALKLPENCTNQLSGVPCQLEMQRRVAFESEAVDPVQSPGRSSHFACLRCCITALEGLLMWVPKFSFH